MIPVYAAETTLPAEITALGALIGIVWWLVKRADASDKVRDDELADTRRELHDERKMHAIELAAMNQKIELHRAEKHQRINELSAARGALFMVSTAMESCDCEALEFVAPMIHKILTEGGHSE